MNLGLSAKDLQDCQVICLWIGKGWKIEAKSKPEKRNGGWGPRRKRSRMCVEVRRRVPKGLQWVYDLKGWKGEGTRSSLLLFSHKGSAEGSANVPCHIWLL